MAGGEEGVCSTGLGGDRSVWRGSKITIPGLEPEDLFVGRGDPFEPAEGDDFLLLSTPDFSVRLVTIFLISAALYFLLISVWSVGVNRGTSAVKGISAR